MYKTKNHYNILIISLLFFIFLLYLGCGRNKKKVNRWQIPTHPAFYVWQRGWNKSVINAVRGCDRAMYFLAAEFSLKNGAIHCVRPDIPKRIKQHKNYTCVFRIHAELLNKLKPEKIVEEFRKIGGNKLQLDFDCPESKINNYRQYLIRVRKLLPDTELSITVLPCHLRHQNFLELVRMLDYYVLQVHGLKYPETINDDVSIIRRDVAEKAIKRAEEIDFPYLIALPTYAYQLNFDKQSGQFKFLSASSSRISNKNVISKLTTLDMNLLQDIIKMKRKGGIIWFRLPVNFDRLNLDMSTLNTLEQGHLPEPSVELLFGRNASGFIELYVRTKNAIRFGSFQAKIIWPRKMGEFDLFNGTRNISEDSSFMVLPGKLDIPYSSCGRKIKAGIFYINSKTPKIEFVK